MKAKRWRSTKVRCPYYKETDWFCIYCTGNVFSNTRISFPNKERRSEYSEKYCEQDFKECTMYQALVQQETE